MRGKIIGVNSVIVIVVGLLAFALMRATIGDVVANPDRARLEADRSTVAANAQLQLEALNLQRWLSQQAADPQVREPFTRETASSRSEIATNQANRLFSALSAEFPTVQPTLIAFVGADGIAVGRNGSSLMRGDDLGKAYPALVDTIKKGRTGSDVWVNKARSDQLFVSYTAVRDAAGAPIGGILLGTPLNDGRINAISEATSGRPVVVGIPQGDTLEIVAKSGKIPESVLASFGSLKVVGLGSDRPQQIAAPAGYLGSGYGVLGYGDGKRAVLVSFAPVALVENVNGLLWPIFGAMGLGIVLVLIAGSLLGNYIQTPIVELEEGLLAVINGQTDRRFELEHAELGGLVFRINTLLNTLMGVTEDDTDAEGRPSHPPRREDFNEAESVDAPRGEAVDRVAVAALRSEPADAYYDRLYNEYIAAKRQIGDPVDHITKEAFVGRMQQSEADASAKQGKAVRYRVELRGREVMLLAVPLE
jgi:hypothetical protein